MGKKRGIVLVVAALIFFAAAVPAQAGIIEFLFPMLRDGGPDPGKTLVAPFADPKVAAQNPQAPQSQAAPGLPENASPLDVPHRNNEQITEWLVMAVSEALTFETENPQQSKDRAALHLGEQARQQYAAFLADSKIEGVLQTNRYYIRSFVREAPILLNEGVVDGRWRWLYQVPVMISYMDRGQRDYKDARPVNQTASIKVQVGRIPPGPEGKDIVIETWAATVDSTVKE